MKEVDNYMINKLYVNPYGTPYDRKDILSDLTLEEHKELDAENKRIDEILRKEREEKEKYLEEMLRKNLGETTSKHMRLVPPGKRMKPQPSKKK